MVQMWRRVVMQVVVIGKRQEESPQAQFGTCIGQEAGNIYTCSNGATSTPILIAVR